MGLGWSFGQRGVEEVSEDMGAMHLPHPGELGGLLEGHPATPPPPIFSVTVTASSSWLQLQPQGGLALGRASSL